jgi:hypothetical protein
MDLDLKEAELRSGKRICPMNTRVAQARSGMFLTGAAMAGTLFLAGCVSPAARAPTPGPAPALELLNTATLQIPAGCEPAQGTVYRMSFVVQPGGRTAGARSESGDGCVQDALRHWVSTFQYQTISAPASTVIDWMAVTATRGG